MKNYPTLHALLLMFVAMGALYGLSQVRWSDLTDNRLKDFDLLEDLFPKENDDVVTADAAPEIDPELELYITQIADHFFENEIAAADSLAPKSESENNLTDTTLMAHAEIPSADASIELSAPIAPERPAATVSADGVVLIENYTGSVADFPRLRSALAQSGDRLVRIAFLGDSFIEGDIISQDLRSKLQDDFGGSGVGYLALHTDMAGFRQSVRQSDSGWKKVLLKNFSSRDTLRLLQAEYSVAAGPAKATFKGSKKPAHTNSWQNSSFLFIAPHSGSLKLSGSDGLATEYQILASENPQYLTLPGRTSEFTVQSDIPGLVGLGVFLDADRGVQVDCMSIRGNSGLNHKNTNLGLCHRLSPWVDYDLIILEFGINAVSPGQTNYSAYVKAMAQSVERIKACYPNADILLLGIADRGSKSGAGVKSLDACRFMVDAQRSLARRTGIHFWDTRAAMGGEGAVVDWRNRKLMNADYIHLNHNGGAELASLLYRSLKKSLDE
ncbi:MAG: hypothetical protein HDT06_03955 [Bacteroidales bacterium]|nr:hypothetical protein [Bacteroidales bacterium]